MSTIDAAIAYNAARPYQLPHWQAIQVSVGTTPDGIPGRLTAEAVAHWQAGMGLAVDGKVGPNTLADMKLEYVPLLDVSHHEGAINWRAVASDPAGYKGVWIKATQGTHRVDPRLQENAHGAADAGLRVGYYHFADTARDTGRGDAMAQVDYFLAAINGLPAPSLPLVLDVEELDEDDKSKSPHGPDRYASWLETFLAALPDCVTPRPMIYTSRRVMAVCAPDHNLGQRAGLSDGDRRHEYELWAPRYPRDPSDLTSPPKLPPGWLYWSIWQYTDKGRVSGISSDVDLNRADPTWWAALSQLSGFSG